MRHRACTGMADARAVLRPLHMRTRSQKLAGHFVTCSLAQKKVRAILKKFFDNPFVWNEVTGLIDTNLNETLYSSVTIIRKKGLNIEPGTNRVRVVGAHCCVLVSVSSVSLCSVSASVRARRRLIILCNCDCDSRCSWRLQMLGLLLADDLRWYAITGELESFFFEILREWERIFQWPEGTLALPAILQLEKASLDRRLKQRQRRSTVEYKEYRARWKKERARLKHPKASVSYDFEHTGDVFVASTRRVQKAKEKAKAADQTSARAKKRGKKRVRCSGCQQYTTHTKRTCMVARYNVANGN